MRTFQQASPRAYVRAGAGQKKFEMYTFEPSPSPSPTVTQSPPPWDGSAEGYGPVRDDYGVFYKEQGYGCAGCGMGATNPWFDDEPAARRNLIIGGLVGGALLLWLIVKKR